MMVMQTNNQTHLTVSLDAVAGEHLRGRFGHILSELLLVGFDVALPWRDRLVVAHPDAVRHLLE